ncbi:protein transport protein Sec16B [Chanos chanos]|uniref:Protein transport protein Sec16B-like n=1 Tax=Chanos chanos TaxID=29144 RepID=A0A6J2WT52_CHACN|nr:protein transport protein Sec16B-like [Chanos chanos]XP_030647416.1 protein transport protein Sec16B-like [Chanos chanos]
MEPRRPNWHGPSNQYHSGPYLNHPRDMDNYHRPPHHGGGPYQPPDPREKPWPAVDPRYGRYLASPPPGPEFIPGYSSTPHHGGSYGPDGPWPQHPRPHSRHGYDYPYHSYWGYREDYGYYDHSHQRGHYNHPEAGQWTPQSVWRPDVSEGRGQERQWSSDTYTDQYTYDQSRERDQHDYGFSERRHREEKGENGEVSQYAPGNLESSKTSGLSSSSYELSQYINGADQYDPLIPPHTEQESKSEVAAPMKFCIPHVAISFGPAGQLVRVCPALPSDGEPGLVELHSLEVILSDTCEQQEMRDFPGPLAREDLHKVDAISFAMQRAELCLKDEKLTDAASAALLWQLLVLLCRQNGRIVGSDIAELLTRDSKSCDGSGEQLDGHSLIDLNETPSLETETLDTTDLLTGTGQSNVESAEEALQKYTKLLLAGRKKDALESAMKSGLWGHALFLASKMGSRPYTTVLGRFTGNLAPGDPLQTLFQLLSGRIPAVATCYSPDRWGDWRQHLAVMLSNETGDGFCHRRSIITMGDTLASRGLLHAAHICYLTAHVPFGVYTNKTERLVLLGSSNSLPFGRFCQSSIIRCTEVFEFSQRLGDPSFIIPSFQVYKFLYACRLLDCGLVSLAFHYCEVVGKALLRMEEPHMVLLREVIKLAERLTQSESQLSDTGVDIPVTDPDWLQWLRHKQHGTQVESYGCSDMYQTPLEQGSWTHAECQENSDLNTEALSGHGEMHSFVQNSSLIGIHHEGNEEAPTYQSYTPLDQTYPPQEQTYSPMDPTHQTYAPVDQAPPVYGSVPTYPAQMAMPPFHTQPEVSEGTVVTSGDPSSPMPPSQDPGPYYMNGPYQQPAAPMTAQTGPFTSGLECSAEKDTMGVSGNVSVLGGVRQGQEVQHEEREKGKEKEKFNAQPEKKPGWFSGWFWSKSKEPPKEEKKDINPAPREVTPNPSLTVSPPPVPMGSRGTGLSHPPPAGVNPFSRKAGQRLGETMGQHRGSISQGP